MVVVSAALFAASYVLAPTTTLAAVLGVACVAVLAAVLTDRLDDRYGLVWLGLGGAAALVYLSPDAASLRSHAISLCAVAIGSALLWFVPAKAAALGERVGDRLREWLAH
ncbi:hypothetical protein MBEHAL_1020 [Halarchaeum acidiphilum MH1-52-1]|uniref:Uncharacterized protein n=2 Tax=Halarchaeum acidiphilum TaxID=489138 RepID=U2YTC2_9EURY|nr:hypothetical protein MBEHAL_1020 [Halarchaeum acidiphilum MH1-52-1]